MAKSLPYNNLKNPSMDPSTFRMVSEFSTIWALILGSLRHSHFEVEEPQKCSSYHHQT